MIPEIETLGVRTLFRRCSFDMYHNEVCDPSPGLQNFPGNALSHGSECHHAFSLHPVAVIITEKKFLQERNGCWTEDMLLEKKINFS